MQGGYFGAVQELKPISRPAETKKDSPDLSPTLKSVSGSGSKGRSLHLFECQGSTLPKYENREPQEQEQEEEHEPEHDHIVHQVLPDDTLEGLSIQYNLSKTTIKVANNLTSDDIFFIKQLKIPQGSPNIKRMQANRDNS